MLLKAAIYTRPFKHLQFVHVRRFDECVKRVTSLIKIVNCEK